MIYAQPGRHRLHRLALAVEHQPAQIQLTLGPLIRPWQFAEHLRGESHQPRPDLGHLLWSHGQSQDHTTDHLPGSDTPNKALLTIIKSGCYRNGENSRRVLPRKPASRPGRYCIRLSRVLTSAVSSAMVCLVRLARDRFRCAHTDSTGLSSWA